MTLWSTVYITAEEQTVSSGAHWPAAKSPATGKTPVGLSESVSVSGLAAQEAAPVTPPISHQEQGVLPRRRRDLEIHVETWRLHRDEALRRDYA